MVENKQASEVAQQISDQKLVGTTIYIYIQNIKYVFGNKSTLLM